MDYEALAKELGGSFVKDTSETTDLDKLIAQYGGSLVKPEAKKKEGALTPLKRGFEQLTSSGQTAIESVTKGGEEAAIRAQERQADIRRRLGEGASLERLKDVYNQQGILAAAKELGSQIPSAILEQAPNIGATVAGGLSGAAAGSLAGPVGTVVGGIGGAFLPSLVQQYGGNIQRQAAAQQDEGKPLDINRGVAAGTAVPQAALDVVGTLIPLGGNIVSKILGPAAGKLIGGGGSKLAEERLLTTVLKGTATGALAEIPTEVTQQMLERAQAGLALTNDDALKEYGETAFAVSLLGPIGIIGRVSNKAQAGRDLAEAQRLAAETGEPQSVPLQLTYDPNVPTTRGTETMTVFPDGRVAPTEEAAFQEQFQRTPIQGTTEAYAIPGDKEAIMAARFAEARANSPAMQKLDEIVAKKQQFLAREQAALDAMKAEQSAFTNADIEGGVIRPPSAEQIAAQEAKTASFNNMRTVAVQKGSNVEIYEGILNDKGKVNVKDPVTGKTLTFNPNSPNVVIDPTEQDIFAFETRGLGEDLKTISKEIKDAEKAVTQKSTNFEEWVKKNPIREEEVTDILPDALEVRSGGKGTKINSSARKFFSKKGSPVDDLARRAVEDGVMTEEELNNVKDTGGVNAFINKLRGIYEGETIETPENRDVLAQIDSLYNQRDQLEQEIERRQARLNQPELEPAAPEQQVAPIPEGVPPATVPTEEIPTTAEVEQLAPVEQPAFRAEVATPYSDKFIAEGEKFAADARKALDRMGLKDVGLKFEEQILRTLDGTTDEISGAYMEQLIRVSLSSSDPIRTLNHEALHAMKDLGMFSPKEWTTLEGMAESKWTKQYDIAANYGQETKEIQLEEAIAHAFADYQKQAPMVKGIANRVRKFLGQLRNLLMGKGFRTAESVFQKAAEGKLTPTKEATVTEQRAEVPSRKKFKAPMQGVDPKIAELAKKQFTQEQATVQQKMEGLKKNFFKRMVTGLFDEFKAIQTMGGKNATAETREAANEAYMMARLSKSIDGGLQGLLEYGQVFLRDGALDIKPNTKGLLKILEPVGPEVDQYQMWKALNRDAALPASKRSLDPELVANREQFARGDLNGKPRKAIYEQVLREENELNRSVLKIAKDLGLIGTTQQEIDRIKNSKLSEVEKKAKIKDLEDNPVGYEKFANDMYYIPFYKMIEEGDVQSVSNAAKLTGQEFSKALKGGGDKKINDLMENVLLNWSHILSAAMKNQAAVKTIDAAISMGAAKEAKQMDGKYPKGSVKVMKDGRPVYYELSDPDLVDAISTISYLGPKSQFLDIARGFTNALRYGITMSPAYKVRNLIRDSIQSAAVSELGNNMFKNVYNGLAMSKDGSPTFMSALAGGGIFEMGTAHEGNQAKLIKRLVDKGVSANQILDTPDKIKGKLGDLLDWYNKQGNRFENANRLALYQKLIDSGKSHLEASYAARDLMDFSMQGQFRAVKILGSLVPFFNARLQGLYKLGRDGITPTYRVICNATTGKPLEIGDKQKAARFATISSAVMLASLSLYAMYKDDEDFKRREDWDRDNFWWFKIGETAFRIPKPFEIGALGTIAERTYEQIADESVEGKVFASRLNHILMDTFSLNPTPQMIKPLIDLYANKDSFTGAPIESGGMENLSKQERINSRTSGLAIALGGLSEGAAKIMTFNPQAQGISPIQMDYAIKAYFGWLGATAASTADLAVEPFQEGTKVRPPIIDIAAMGFIKTEPQTQSKYMTQFYQNNANLQSAAADMRHYAELGDAEKVQKIYEERGDDIALAKLYDKTSKQFALLRKQSRLIENNPNIPTEEKRAEMNRLRILMSTMAEQVEDMRKQLKK
jgi:hypothetical protein